jgi:hypothetical protein
MWPLAARIAATGAFCTTGTASGQATPEGNIFGSHWHVLLLLHDAPHD